MRLTFVVPTFNEPEVSLVASLRALVQTQVERKPYEILVVDDSSPDHEDQIRAAVDRVAAEVGGDASLRMLRGPRRGKGAAIRLGALTSTGEIVFLVDADIPVPLHHVAQFAALLADGVDVVVAERPLSRHRDPVRRILSRGLLIIQSAIVFHSLLFKDTQCGFKAFRGDVLRALASRQIVECGMYDLEYLYMTAQSELVFVRIPVDPNPEVRESRINVWRCLRRDPLDIVRVKAHGVFRRMRGARFVIERTPFGNPVMTPEDAQNSSPPAHAAQLSTGGNGREVLRAQ